MFIVILKPTQNKLSCLVSRKFVYICHLKPRLNCLEKNVRSVFLKMHDFCGFVDSFIYPLRLLLDFDCDIFVLCK